MGCEGATDALGSLQVRFGLAGLSCRSRAGCHRRSLKRLFQEAGIPPWLRPLVPLVLAEDRLVAVAGVCSCAGGPGGDSELGPVRWRGHPWEALGFFR
ncbi:MAG: tRNA lysidine(34) synthetase TilS [Bdellovibrio bacteriovorus]